MEVCNICGREFKNVAGLKIHQKNCKPVEVVEETLFQEPIKNEIIDGVSLTPRQREIMKLTDKARSTFDAESRYGIECEIRRLMELEK